MFNQNGPGKWAIGSSAQKLFDFQLYLMLWWVPMGPLAVVWTPAVMITTLLTDDLAPSVSFPPSPPAPDHISSLRVADPCSRRSRCRASPGSSSTAPRRTWGPCWCRPSKSGCCQVHRNKCEQSLHLVAIIRRCQCLETCYLMANNLEKLGR